MDNVKTYMVLIGFLVMLICQDLVAVKAFRKSVKEGMLCLLIPGYLLIYGSRDENRQVKPLVGWLIGLAILLMGFER